MTRPRSEFLDLDSTTLYHCISRCVRRAFLCGTDAYTGKCFEHRKSWIEARLFFLAQFFAIDIYAFAVMSNHLHLVLRVDVDAALLWSDAQVVERYTKLFKNAEPLLKASKGKARRELIALWRKRLQDVSWFMRMLNEDIARRANKEDGVTGRFWEGRFKCVPLLDDRSLLSCMAYVDLNHVRARIVTKLDTRVHSSIARRLASASVPRGLVPFADQASAGATIPMTFSDYLQVLEWTIRAQASDEGDVAPEAFMELGLDQAAWLETMTHEGLRMFSVLGSTEKLQAFATKHGKRWVRGKSLAAD